MWVADQVDDALHDYKAAHGILDTWETRERVVVALTGAPSGEHLIRRAARMATRTRGDLIGRARPAQRRPGRAVRTALLEEHRELLEGLGGEYHEVVGADVATALTDFARAENATQLVLGASGRSRWAELVSGSVINDVLRRARGIDVHVISDRRADAREPTARRRAPPPAASRRCRRRRQRSAGWSCSLGIPLLTLVAGQPARDTFSLPSHLLLYLLLVVVAAAVGGVGPGGGGRGGRLPVRQLVLHAAVPPAHHRRTARTRSPWSSSSSSARW